jgi:hypothetical protein
VNGARRNASLFAAVVAVSQACAQGHSGWYRPSESNDLIPWREVVEAADLRSKARILGVSSLSSDRVIILRALAGVWSGERFEMFYVLRRQADSLRVVWRALARHEIRDASVAAEPAFAVWAALDVCSRNTLVYHAPQTRGDTASVSFALRDSLIRVPAAYEWSESVGTYVVRDMPNRGPGC